MEYLKDYDFELIYHPGKGNVVADALSRKQVHMSSLMIKKLELIEKLRDMNMGLQLDSDHIKCSMLKVTNTFLEEIREGQWHYAELQQIVGWLGTKKKKKFKMGADGILRFRDRVCVHGNWRMRRRILDEGHKGHLSIHLGMTKMYKDLKESFWWPRMKIDVVDFVASCLVCQKAKIEHQRPGGTLQPLNIP